MTLLTVVSFLALASAFGVAAASHATAAHAPAAAVAGAHPLVARAPPALPGPANVSAAFTNGFTTNARPFFVLPINVTWTTSIKNATITSSNLTQYLNVTFHGIPAFSAVYTGTGPSCASATSCSYFQAIATSDILASFGRTATQLPSGQYVFHLDVWGMNSSAPLPNATLAGIAIQAATNLAGAAAFGQFTAPAASTVGGIVTISGNYTGYYLIGAVVTVTNASGGIQFTESVFAAGLGTHAFTGFWTVVTAGTYTLSLGLQQQWGVTATFTSTATITSPPPTTYLNKTGGTAGLISGLGAGGSASLLLTVGVVIGMIVMAVVGRGLWKGAPVTPAQPWAPKAGGPMECGVCHQTFATEDELKEHSKSQHGTTM